MSQCPNCKALHDNTKFGDFCCQAHQMASKLFLEATFGTSLPRYFSPDKSTSPPPLISSPKKERRSKTARIHKNFCEQFGFLV
jgi:hypothetical protein